jgi:pimeloyl-ACP methyl ester carboxylesterase
LVGKEDAITPLERSEWMHQKSPRFILRVISNAGHLSNMENPEEFNQALLEFLKTI